MADVVNLQPPTDADDPVGDFAAALRAAGQRGELPRGKPQQPVFAPSAPMPGVVPEDTSTMAMDSAIGNSTNWAADQLIAAYYADGMSFLGYPLLAELAQRGEYRRLSEVIATEMTREWIELKSSSDEDKSLEINALKDEIKRLGVQDAFRRLAEQDGFFGRAHLYIDLGTTDTPDELKTPIGHGRDLISQAKIRKGGLKALRTVEAVWTYPIDYNASDPLRADWYKPQSWFVMGKMIHATRLLTLVGREVPDLLKPAYMFGGLPLSQMAKTYIDKWTQTRDSVADLIRSFSTAVMLTDLTAMLNNGGQQIVQNRADLYNFFRDNRALLILNKETEEFQNISTPLAGLDALQAQSQEHICSISGLPLIKYTGLTPSGLNASSEGEIRSFYDWIAAYQELLFREPLTRVIDFIQLSRLGRVDPDITFDFKSLWQLDEAGKASVQATKADIHSKYEEMGAVSNEEVRRILATDPESPYIALEMDPEELPAEPPAPPMAGAGQPALGGPPRPPGGGPHQGGATTAVTSPFGAGRDPAAGRQSLAARRIGDMALDQEAPVPLDLDLLEIARGAPANVIQYIYGMQAERNRSRPANGGLAFEEGEGSTTSPFHDGLRDELLLRGFHTVDEDGFGHRVYRHDANGDHVHAYEHHDLGPELWTHVDDTGHELGRGRGGSEELASHLDNPERWPEDFVTGFYGPDEAEDLAADAEFKEEQHKRDKGGKFSSTGEGGGGKAEIPKPPQITSTHGPNIGKQKHLNQLHQHAQAGEWGKVEAYPTPGSNTYAKMVQKYKADLLKQKPGGAAEPAVKTQTMGVPPLYGATLSKLGFKQAAKHPETGATLFNNEAGGSILVKPPTAVGENSTWEYLGPGGAKFSGTGLASLQGVIEPEAPAQKVSPLKVTKAAQAAGFEMSGTPGTMVNPASGHVLIAKPEGQWSIKEKNGDLVSSGGSFETLKNDLEFGAAKGEYGKAKPEAPAPAETVVKPPGATAIYPIEETAKWSADPYSVPAEPAIRYSNAAGSESLVIGTGVNNKGKWQIWQQGKPASKGSGQNELNAAFEALHPRGPGGKFKKSDQPEHFTLASPEPAELNGVPFAPFKPPADWKNVAGQKPDLVEPPMQVPPGKHASAGLLIQEPDGRVWIVKPTQGFGGYDYTFPKGTQDPGLSLQQTAIKEAFEESGLHGEITGYAGDYQGQTSITRYYLAKRIGGTPTGFEKESEGVSLIPPEQLHDYLNTLRDKNIASTHFPPEAPPPPKPVIGHQVDIGQMKKIGGQIGSNPGGKYEDDAGNKYYAKFLKSPDHAKNELLAAALYNAVGSPTLNYHPDKDDKTIATEWQEPDKKGGVSSFTPAERKAAQADFATHAWLANWDAAGLGGDNQQIIGGKPTTVDTGGSLLYRAQGTPKGSAFNPAASEWETMRDPKANKDSADLYGDMTPEQLKASADRLAKITDSQIRNLVDQNGPGATQDKANLADVLIARKKAILQKATPKPTVASMKPDAMRKAIAEWNPPGKPSGAITHYKGNGYRPMNALMRYCDMDEAQTSNADMCRKIKDWLDKGEAQEDLVLYRGVAKGEFTDRMKQIADVGLLTKERGFTSMATDINFSRGWAGSAGLLYTIKVPKGSKIGTVKTPNEEDSEYEVLAQTGSRFKITGITTDSGRTHLLVELDQAKLGWA